MCAMCGALRSALFQSTETSTKFPAEQIFAVSWPVRTPGVRDAGRCVRPPGASGHVEHGRHGATAACPLPEVER